jgi:sugar phosphate isomerase/epimerase
MLKAISTFVYVKERLHPGLLDGLVRGGAGAVEIFAARQHLDYANRKQHVREIADWFRTSGVTLHSVHAPLYADYEWGRTGAPPMNVASTDRASRIAAMDEIKRALELAEQIPFRFLVQHLGASGESFDDRKFEAAMTSVEHLRAFAKPLGVRILLENIPNELSTPERLVEFIRAAHFDDVGVCFGITCIPLMSTTTPKTGTRIFGREADQSTGNRPWSCCARRRTLRRCCWRSKATRKSIPSKRCAKHSKSWKLCSAG